MNQGNTAIKPAMELAGQNLINMLHPDYDYLPSFLIAVDRDYKADRQFFFMTHNIGRWVDAMYRLEAATSFAAPEKIQEAMFCHIKAFCDNPDDLFLRPLDKLPYGEGDLFCFHSLREHLAAFCMLGKVKKNQWALDSAHRMLVKLESLLLPRDKWVAEQRVWDIEKTKRYMHLGLKKIHPGWNLNLQGSEGRLIEPLIWYYELTGDVLALNLADRFARFHLDYSTSPDGAFYGGSLAGHNHSYMGTIRGLLAYGRFSGQHEYVDAVAKTYQVAFPTIITPSGYCTHDLDKEMGGDISSAGDVAQIALWLGMYHGYADYLDDVQRIVVSRLLPCQITESPPLQPKDTERKPRQEFLPDGRLALFDYPENMEHIIIGALGGIYGHPYGAKWSVVDVTASALHSLVDVYNHVAQETENEIRVYFHFDYDTDFVKISSERSEDGEIATLTIEPKVRKNLWVRIPGWVPGDSLRVTVDGKTTATRVSQFLVINANDLPGRVQLKYERPLHKSVERVNGTDYELTWRGDEVVGICPNTGFYPFYTTTSGCDG